jgi:hypothetical protein
VSDDFYLSNNPLENGCLSYAESLGLSDMLDDLPSACDVGTKKNSKGYTKIYSNTNAFAALRADGSIVAWGDSFGQQRHMYLNKSRYNLRQRVRLYLHYLSCPMP